MALIMPGNYEFSPNLHLNKWENPYYTNRKILTKRTTGSLSEGQLLAHFWKRLIFRTKPFPEHI